MALDGAKDEVGVLKPEVGVVMIERIGGLTVEGVCKEGRVYWRLRAGIAPVKCAVSQTCPARASSMTQFLRGDGASAPDACMSVSERVRTHLVGIVMCRRRLGE